MGQCACLPILDRYFIGLRRIALKTNFTRGITITLIRFRFFLVIPRRPLPLPPPPLIPSFLFSSTNRVTRIHEFLHTIVLKPWNSNISSLLNSRFVCGGEMNFLRSNSETQIPFPPSPRPPPGREKTERNQSRAELFLE